MVLDYDVNHNISKNEIENTIMCRNCNMIYWCFIFSRSLI